MKILMVNKFLYPRGGAETYMLKIGAHLTSLGHTVEYFGMYDERNVVGNSAGQYTFHMEFRRKSLQSALYPFKILYSLEARRKLCRVLDQFKPDVVHLNNINFQLTPSVIDAVASRNIPLVQTVHDYQMVCPNHLLYNLSRQSVCERCVHGSKWNCAKYRCIHGSFVKSVLGSLEGILYDRKSTYGKVDHYICPSHFLEQMLLNARGRYSGKTTVLRNFIELPELDRLRSGERGGPQADVVFAGRLDPEKGIGLLAQAARLLPDVQFAVAGTGSMAAALQGLDNVCLTGFLSGEELQRLIAGAGVMAVPSIWYENCPLSILEAQSLGTPVVAVNAGGMAELVEDGVTGVLLERAEGAALASALRRVLSDRAGLAAMSQNCLNRRAQMQTLEGYCEKLIELYVRCSR